VTLSSLLSDIPSQAIIGHERDSSEQAVDTLDLQPFSYRTWVYAQAGGVDALDAVTDELKNDIPDHIRRNIEGETVEELCFHRFLTVLSDRGDLELTKKDASRGAEALARSVRAIESRLEDVAASDGCLGADVVTVSDRLLLAARTQGPMYYRVWRGIEEPVEEPLFAGHRPKPDQHPHFKAVIVTNEMNGNPGDAWHLLERQQVLWVDDDWNVQVADIDELLNQQA
jgi:glutamine amidotransferase